MIKAIVESHKPKITLEMDWDTAHALYVSLDAEYDMSPELDELFDSLYAIGMRAGSPDGLVD